MLVSGEGRMIAAFWVAGVPGLFLQPVSGEASVTNWRERCL